MNDSLFETLTYGDFDSPFDTIDGVAHFILNLENNGLLYDGLRYVIRCQAMTGQPPVWSDTALGIVRGMREARLFMDENLLREMHLSELGIHLDEAGIRQIQIAAAKSILSRAIKILRSRSFT